MLINDIEEAFARFLIVRYRTPEQVEAAIRLISGTPLDINHTIELTKIAESVRFDQVDIPSFINRERLDTLSPLDIRQ